VRRYESILIDMEQRINEGQYRPGHKLPSVRAAAEFYGCSISTVIRAYAELEKRHAIYSMAQSGHYVIGASEEVLPAREGSSLIDFSASSPDVNVFPYLDFQHCLNKAIDTYKYNLFTYGDSNGLMKLRQTLASHLTGDQVFAKPEQIVITSGIQQPLEMLAKMPFPSGNKLILLEQPSYDHYLQFLEMEGIPVRGIARSASGINLQELEEMFKHGGIKFFYTMSRYHNPLGTSYSTEERKAIAYLAGKYNVYIVEDDYMGDLGEDSGGSPIYAYSQTSHVIYLKSFSKIIFPGLRLGAVVLPESLRDAFHAFNRYVGTSLLSQAALEVYIKNGMYERHRHKISGQYTKRILLLNEALLRNNHEGWIETPRIHSGIYMQCKLPLTINLERLIKRLEARGVSVVSGKRFYLSGYLEREKFLRISISRAQPEQIEKGVQAIIEEVRRDTR
jgi:DNA-binding transcriptional MocR family regulator